MNSSTNKKKSKQPDFVSISDVYFDRIKHYQDDSRQMIWIKLYLNLLDDVDFCLLSDDCKFHFLGLLLLAAKLNNRLPNNPQFLSQKLSATSEIDVAELLSKNFLIPFKPLKTKDKSDSNVLSNGYQNACLEEKRIEEIKNEKKKEENEKKKEEKNGVAFAPSFRKNVRGNGEARVEETRTHAQDADFSKEIQNNFYNDFLEKNPHLDAFELMKAIQKGEYNRQIESFQITQQQQNQEI